jgi:8-oxo-dGTP diphosphatase
MGQQDQGLSTSAERYKVVPRTLCFLRHGDDVLLLKGAPDKRLWANLYNGVGGHVEAGEDVFTAAVREICEETGWAMEEVGGLWLRAIVNVDAGDPQMGVLLFVFTGAARTRQTRQSMEGTLEWVPRSELQDCALVEDLTVLLPRVLALPDGAQPLYARYSYDENDKLVIRFNPLDLPDAT